MSNKKSGAVCTLRFLEMLKKCCLEELKTIREVLGTMVHEVLTKKCAHAETSYPLKLILVNSAAAGKDAQTIASHDGSSKYLIGGLVNYGQETTENNLNRVPEESIRAVFNFLKQEGVDDRILIAAGEGFTSGPQEGEFSIYAGTKECTVHDRFNAEISDAIAKKDKKAVYQEIAAIVSLAQLLTISGMTENAIIIGIEKTKNLPVDSNPFLLKSQQIEKINAQCWEELSNFLKHNIKTHPNMKISVGESFTSGLLAGLIITTPDAATIFDTSLNWYDKRLKIFVGVPEEDLTDALIAEPKTIALASQGLLNKVPLTTGICIGTTGWANYRNKGEPDYFSIGIAQREEKDPTKSTVSTAKVQVIITKNELKNKGKRQLTRQLGVTTALYLLARLLENHFEEFKPKISVIKNRLLALIQQNGTIEVQDLPIT